MQPSPIYRFLIVGDLSDDYSMQVLQKALDALGPVEVASKNDALRQLQETQYAAVIVDAGAVSDAAALVFKIRESNPNIKVAVITATPHWRVARAVFRAGAADYLRKSQDIQEIRTTFRKLLEEPG
jgi:DNA-binding NtrC family response regulator